MSIFAVSSTGGGGGGGTVTSVSAGNLSPLFTTAVGSPTVAPSITFALVSQAANLVYASPNGGAGVPSFRALVSADIPSLNYWALDGNTVGSEKWFGTIDNFDLPFRANNTEWMKLRSIGQFTIGGGSDAFYQMKINTLAPFIGGLFIDNGARSGYCLELGASSGNGLYITAPINNDAITVIAGRSKFGGIVGIGSPAQAAYSLRVTSDGSFSSDSCIRVENTSTSGTHSGIDVNLTTAGTQTQYGAYIDVSGGANNYAIAVLNGFSGFGTTTPTAKLHIVSSGSSSATYALKIDNASSSNLFHLRNDGRASFGTGVGTGQFRIEAVVTDDYLLYVNGNVNDSAQVFFNGSKYGVAIKTANTDSDKYALDVRNSAGSSLLYVQNNGTVAMRTLQTGNAGLASGDLYVDSAANILANGDLVVARKV
jgi:hypothetical protein